MCNLLSQLKVHKLIPQGLQEVMNSCWFFTGPSKYYPITHQRSGFCSWMNFFTRLGQGISTVQIQLPNVHQVEMLWNSHRAFLEVSFCAKILSLSLEWSKKAKISIAYDSQHGFLLICMNWIISSMRLKALVEWKGIFQGWLKEG